MLTMEQESPQEGKRLWRDVTSSSVFRDKEKGLMDVGSSERCSTAASGVCWEEALMCQGGKGNMNHLMGLASSLFGQGPQSRAGGTWSTPCYGFRDQSGMGAEITQTYASQNPTYQMRMVMTRTAASTKKAKIPRDTRMAIFSRGSLRAGQRDYHS